MREYLKNVSRGKISASISKIILFLLIAGSLFAQHSIKVSADKVVCKPGDIVTFSIKENVVGDLDRRELTFNGFYVDWKDSHQWVATPGVHYLRGYIRWLTGELRENGKPEKAFMHKWVIIHVSGYEKEGGYNHPGLEVTADELDQIHKNRKKSGHPVQLAWDGFKKNVDAKYGVDYIPHPADTINMKIASDKKAWDTDGNAVYGLALAWAVGGEQKYAKAAIRILNEWTAINTSLMATTIDVYPFLHATNRYDAWVQAAELLKYYKGHGGSGWKTEDVKKFDMYVRNVLAAMTLGWAGNFGSPFGTQNQPLNVAKARMMFGIYLNDEALFQNGYDWMFASTIGPYHGDQKYKPILGKNYVSIFEMSVGPGGEYMEINRDEGHMNMCVGTIQKVAEVLWRQKGYFKGAGVYDRFVSNESTPRFFQGVEWLSKAALEGGAKASKIGEVTIGKGRLGSIEQVYNHYVHRLKNKYPLPESFLKHLKEQRANNRGGIDVLLHYDLDK